ncbi:MAG: DsbA family protein [Solirubrobacteraceae bacterium]
MFAILLLTTGSNGLARVTAPGHPGARPSAGSGGIARRLSSARRGSNSTNPYARYETRVAGDPLALGRLNAPVVMVEWSDYQCPFCGIFARDTMPALVRKYVDTGKLRFEWRDFPYLGPQSTAAAIAARAAGLQGRFWAFHNFLYAHQQPVDSGRLTTSYFLGIARALHLNVKRFKAALSDQALADQVDADYNQGMDVGVMATPTFLVGATKVVGAQPLATFEKVINSQLHVRR